MKRVFSFVVSLLAVLFIVMGVRWLIAPDGIALEFGLIFCGFPAMVYLVNRRMESVQTRVRAELDAASRKFGARGVNLQLRQGVIGAGAGTNMWVELLVLPLIQVRERD